MKSVVFVLFSVLCMGLVAHAEDPVVFPDARLKAAVEEELWISNPTPTDMLGLTSFNAVAQNISDLTGLEYASNLQTLRLSFNDIGDLSPLSGLTNLTLLSVSENELGDISPLASLSNLETLSLNQNKIGDLSPLAGLTSLRSLDVHHNEIGDISALAGLTGLSDLALRENPLSDISPLAGLPNLRDLSLIDTKVSDITPLLSLTSLSYLDLRNCRLTQEAYDVHIPQIRANNPGILIELDDHVGRLLSASSTAGGSIIDPGEGEILYDYDAWVRLEAKADPGFVFAGWSGTLPASENPLFIELERDYQMRAHFVSLRDTLYVDGAAFHDPGPDDPTLSDPNENGTAEHPFDSLQETLDVAGEGATVFVAAGTYRENISLPRRTVRLIGMDPNDPSRSSWPVIEGVRNEPVVRFDYSPRSKSLLRGFVITHGRGHPAGAIHCNEASPTITHCLIVGNRSPGEKGATVYCMNSKAVLTNCTIADNYAGPNGAGLTIIDSTVTVLDSILWDNLPEEIRVDGDESVPDIRYCAVRGWWPDWGNIHQNPLFARAGLWVNPDKPEEVLGSADPRAVWVEGDYHLKSQTGRWDPYQQSWVQDESHSPAIDAGLSTSPVGQEPAPSGNRVNMGVYGGTAEASKSLLQTTSP